ncbi:MAG: DNA-binding protein [Sulfurospirillaceae bacterium]|nr:DNA-binding protein [Sulfurospirillaceae bacterium]MDD3462142.1 DNA-binding protein [Sulfurospirillaceae bacterium]
MDIEFKKIPLSGISFEVSLNDVKFVGNAKKNDSSLVVCKGKLIGSAPHICDRCGETHTISLNEEVEVYANDGIYSHSEELLNVIEFFDGAINFDTMLQSELEAFMSDYHYCSQCEQKQGD